MRTLRAAWRSSVDGDIVVLPVTLVGLAVAITSISVGAHRGDIRVDIALASMAAFLFGVLMAFTIARTRERLALIQDLVAKGNAALLSIHQMMEVFGEGDRNRVRQLIDRQLTDQIDYRLVDNHLSSPSQLNWPAPSTNSSPAPVSWRPSTRSWSNSRSTWEPTGPSSKRRPARRSPQSSGVGSCSCSSCSSA